MNADDFTGALEASAHRVSDIMDMEPDAKTRVGTWVSVDPSADGHFEVEEPKAPSPLPSMEGSDTELDHDDEFPRSPSAQELVTLSEIEQLVHRQGEINISQLRVEYCDRFQKDINLHGHRKLKELLSVGQERGLCRLSERRNTIFVTRNEDYVTHQYNGIGKRRDGDWVCSDCGFNNFAFRYGCKHCGQHKRRRSSPR